MSYRDAYAAALYNFRNARGWTIEEFARQLRRKGRAPSSQTLGQWERGVRLPMRKWLPALTRIGFVPPPRKQPSPMTRPA